MGAPLLCSDPTPATSSEKTKQCASPCAKDEQVRIVVLRIAQTIEK